MSINELRKWDETLVYWEKVALEKIMSGQQKNSCKSNHLKESS